MDIRYVKLKVVNAFKSFFGLNVKKKIAVGGKADTNTRTLTTAEWCAEKNKRRIEKLRIMKAEGWDIPDAVVNGI